MSITPTAVADAVGAVTAAIAAVGTLQGASDAALAPVVTAILSAQSIIAAEIASTDQTIGPGIGIAAGTPPAQAIAWLEAQITATQTDANLLAMQAYLNRVALNIAQRL
jgi:hypothetical protein